MSGPRLATSIPVGERIVHSLESEVDVKHPIRTGPDPARSRS